MPRLLVVTSLQQIEHNENGSRFWDWVSIRESLDATGRLISAGEILDPCEKNFVVESENGETFDFFVPSFFAKPGESNQASDPLEYRKVRGDNRRRSKSCEERRYSSAVSYHHNTRVQPIEGLLCHRASGQLSLMAH